jgi:cysteine desulfurase family protein (TIGR01976 family)
MIMTFDVEWVRSQFPALKRHHNGQPVIYLDGPGGTQIPSRVADRVRDHMLYHFANVYGVYPTSQETDAVMLEAREAFAALIGCGADEISFGQNATSLFYKLAWALAKDIKPGDEVLVTDVDHEANRGPWAILAEKGAVIKSVQLDKENMCIDYADYEQQLSPRTRVVALNHASNAIGSIHDVVTLVAKAKAVGAYTIIDAVHSVLHMPIDVKEIGCDFLGCSAYKFYGPHLGVMYARKEVLEKLNTDPLITQKQEAPYKIEMGTQNHEHIAGAAETVHFLASIGQRHEKRYGDKVKGLSGLRRDLSIAIHAMQEYEMELCDALLTGLEQIPGITVWGPPRGKPRTSTVAITLDGLHAKDFAEQLAERGIFLMYGHFYALRLIAELGLLDAGGVVRLGLVHFHTPADVERVLDVVREIAERKG